MEQNFIQSDHDRERDLKVSFSNSNMFSLVEDTFVVAGMAKISVITLFVSTLKYQINMRLS